MLLVDGSELLDIFDVVELDGGLARVRTAYLFELGEEFSVRLEEDGAQFEAPARVRSHLGSGPDKITELEVGERTKVTG
jgi:hypothetical protein